MILNKSFIIFMLLMQVNLIFSQTITGNIIDAETKKPIENVNIYLHNKKHIGTVSNKDGSFSLTVKVKVKETDSITFSILGYKIYTAPIRQFKKLTLIKLSKTINELDQVTIKAKKLQSSIKYNKIGNIKINVFSFSSIIIGNKLYISGGDKSIVDDNFQRTKDKAGPAATIMDILSDLEMSISYKSYSDELAIYNLDNLALNKESIKIENRAYHQMNVYNNKLYILGGKKATNFNNNEYLLNKIEVIDIKSKNIEIDQTNPHKAVNFASFVYKDYLFTLGGSTKIKKNGDKVFTDKIHLYNLKTGLWYEISKLTSPKECRGIVLEDKMYLIGGINNQPLNTIESWNLTTNKWKVENELFSAIERPALAINKHIIYIFDYGKILSYNTINNTLKEYKINLLIKNANMHYYKDALYLIGGVIEKNYSVEPSTAIYKIDLSEFNKTKINNYK